MSSTTAIKSLEMVSSPCFIVLIMVASLSSSLLSATVSCQAKDFKSCPRRTSCINLKSVIECSERQSKRQSVQSYWHRPRAESSPSHRAGSKRCCILEELSVTNRSFQDAEWSVTRCSELVVERERLSRLHGLAPQHPIDSQVDHRKSVPIQAL